MGEDRILQAPDLTAVRAGRARLGRTLARARECVAAGSDDAPEPADPSGQERGGAWVEDLRRALDEVARAWQAHVADAESPSGLLRQIETDAPRCAPHVTRLHREHVRLGARLSAVVGALDHAASTADVVRALPALETLLDALVRHRAEGGDLIHEAYRVDIGGE
jgi:hypothetical protein